MKKDECIFCKIAAGEIPSACVYEDDDFKAILDISPASKGHVIIIPKNHADNIFDLTKDEAAKVFVIAANIGKILMNELNCDGLNVLQNNGAAAGQTVFHFHMHLIPRFENDKVKITWTSTKYIEGEMDQLAKAIKEKL
ncbi:histidine triad (HIT) family protein [Mobilisporobacter senegalensis]|uniref:Histidine triad (HIT) family protein n=1 Tax=Mobilisporobacter senegalensis TaxID=1329262 RepID=A0A3N1XA99_9FIRM|nr:HIT family protein [Mobilisporobacter senegalensis]ROR23663.1 histidine triad (HIT) family protein [Mobilisporobacter senegalensis]